jgi:transcriptional regulator
MYQPAEFGNDAPVQAFEHIARNPMGILVTHHDGEFAATHLPFLLDDDDAPTGVVSHFALRNTALETLPDDTEVLVVFPGPHAYVSPSHYTAEADVPTWNYSAVHVQGTYRRLPAEQLAPLLSRTVNQFERTQASPFSLSTMDPADLNSLARAVVAFEVRPRVIKGGYKLSQDKLQPDVDGVIEGFQRSGNPDQLAVADEMRRHGVTGRTGDSSTDPANWMD